MMVKTPCTGLALCRMQDYFPGMSLHSHDVRIPLRLKAYREARKLSQADLASAMGFKDRQTVAAIEAGARQLKPEELARAANILGVDVEAVLDPYRLVGEGRFSFRAKDIDPAELRRFEDRAGGWMAMYRELCTRFGEEASPLGRKLELAETSSFEDAASAGEALAEEWALGPVPAARLQEAIEQRLNVLVLYVDAPDAISGAALQLPRYNAILVNRNEPAGRRSFDLAHELFHILTWDAMPPRRVEPVELPKKKGNRVEYLAENFAAGLLMPGQLIARLWKARGTTDLVHWIARTAAELRVSTVSLQWRLVNLNLITRVQAESLQPSPRMPGVHGEGERPLLFSERFIALVARAVDSGRLSLRRAAGLLGLPVADFADLCSAHGCRLSYDLGG